MKIKERMSRFLHPRASMNRKRKLRSVLGLLLCLVDPLAGGCGGTVGEVLWSPHPGEPLGQVPAGCADGLIEEVTCWRDDAWAQAAERACARQGLSRSAHVPVDPCGEGFHYGVYHRCCPVKEQQPPSNASVTVPAWPGLPGKE
jgi:hypothetical protein